MSHKRVPPFSVILVVSQNFYLCISSFLKFLAPVVDRLPNRWRFAISSSEMTLYKSNGVRLR